MPLVWMLNMSNPFRIRGEMMHSRETPTVCPTPCSGTSWRSKKGLVHTMGYEGLKSGEREVQWKGDLCAVCNVGTFY